MLETRHLGPFAAAIAAPIAAPRALKADPVPVHPSPMRLGEVIAGRFEIQRLAGSGGMGTVYRSMDRATGGEVALKLLGGSAPNAVARFEHEARILAELRHPRIVRYIDHGVTHDGEPYLAMEWLEGESLAQRLAREPLLVVETLALARATAEALEAAHGLGIVHRDIKPSNLFLAGCEVSGLKVLDFGIARMARTMGTFTQTGSVMGTPGYMAPEQVRGERERLDARADVFSMGAVLFECLAGRPAFQGQHVMALLAKLLIEEAPRLREIRPELPQELDDLVAQMLSKDPEQRPRDGAAVAETLEELSVSSRRGSEFTPDLREAITASELRMLSIVVAKEAWKQPTTSSASTLDAGLSRELLTKIHAVVQPLGARMDELADGTLVLSLAGTGDTADQAARAARCALHLRELLSGSPVVLATGRAEQTGRSPVGPVMERAAALLSPAAAMGAYPGWQVMPVRIDDVTRALLDARFEVDESPRGLFLLRERDVGRHARTLLGKPSPCVGRDRELRNLRELVEESFDQAEARALLVTGPAGIGKSRLRHELLEDLCRRRPDVAMMTGRGDSMSAGSRFSLLGSAIRGAAGITGGEPAAVQREKLSSLVGRAQVKDRERVAAFLGEIVGTPFPDDADPKLRTARQDPPAMADQIAAAYLELMAAGCELGPSLLVLEDLHWGDTASMKLIDRALSELRDRPFVVLSLARLEVHEVFPKLWEGREMQEMKLGALPRRAAEELVRRTLGESIAEAEVARVVERAAGNALCLEELIRAVAEGRGESMPETILGMVQARIESLPAEARRLLRAASVFGETFWRAGALALLGDPDGATSTVDWFTWLLDRELILGRARSRFADQDEYAFRHALIRDGSYAMLTQRDRVLGHNLAAEWLLQVGEHDSKVLAEHFERGGEPGLAVELYLRAAEQALAGGDHAAAFALAERGLGFGEGGDTDAMFRAVRENASMLEGGRPRASGAPGGAP